MKALPGIRRTTDLEVSGIQTVMGGNHLQLRRCLFPSGTTVGFTAAQVRQPIHEIKATLSDPGAAPFLLKDFGRQEGKYIRFFCTSDKPEKTKGGKKR